MHPSPPGSALARAGLPAEIRPAFLFATFNALSFQIVLGGPMVLYAKTLGASATVLGIIAGMLPLLVIFQIPAANHVERIGYKRFVYAGWGTRVVLIFIVALVPLTSGFLDAGTRLALVLFLLFGFNLSRGISSAAWLPWMTSLVPLEVRGKYLARDAVCVHMASCATLILAAFCLGRDPAAWQFALLFAFSAVNGFISLGFLKKIPDVPPATPPVGSRAPVPWGAIARHDPFRKLLRMSVAWSMAYGGLTTFTVAFLKAEAAMTDGRIMLVTALSFLGGLAGLVYFESRTDRLGSKPVVTFCLGLWVVLMLAWAAVSGGWCRPGLPLVLGLQWVMGFAYALVNMNLTRLAMVLVPAMGRSHFFALYSVVANLTLGLSPILWGLIIDAIGPRQHVWRGYALNGYGVFFLGAGVMFVATLVLSRQLEEPKARDMDALIRELLEYPQRLWLRLWPRG